MDSGRYRIVLTGELVSGFSREAVIASLARLFETSAGKLVDVFDNGDYAVDEWFSAGEASRLQQRLEKLGAHARVESADDAPPAAGNVRLPRRVDPNDAGLMHCPACGHAQLVARSCDECGVVFADYNRRRRAEREAAAFAAPPSVQRPAVAPRAAPQPATPGQGPTARQSRPARTAHAYKDDGWHDNWVDDGDELPTEQYHVNLFMGQRSAKLADACQRMMLGPRTHLAFSWTGGAFVSPFLWAMYRKMWFWGAVMFVTEILLPILLISLGLKPDISDKLIYLGLAGIVLNRLFWPVIAKYLYCRHARLTIAAMHRASPTYAPDIDIATAGGTSRTSVFVGVVLGIVGSLLTWNIVDTVHTRVAGTPPVFSEPPAAPEWTQPGNSRPVPGVGLPANEAPPLSNENKWVMTRNKLRTLGQRLNTWFGSAGADVDPTRLSMADISQALLLGFDATLDGWGKQIAYRYEGKGYVLISAGPDGEFDTADDLKYRRSLAR